MAYTTIDDPSAHFKVQKYTGNYSDAHAITFDDTDTDMQPDLVVAKQTDGADAWYCSDAVRGVTKSLYWDVSTAEETIAEGIQAFGSDGFTVGQTNAINQSSAANVAYCWKGGTTSGITTDGNTTITPSGYSFNQTAGFSILKFTGNQVNGAKLAHGLSSAPEMVFFKTLETASTWGGYNKTITATKYIKLDSTAAGTSYALAFANTEPDAVNMTLGSWEAVNGNVGVEEMIAYAFTSIQGYSKVGSYTGNGDNDGAFVYTGFRPAMVIYKKSSGTENWFIHDNKRQGYNPDNEYLFPDLSNAEGTVNRIDLLSNGFKATTSDGGINASGATYIYMAFAEAPFVNSNGVPCNAR